jgi:putative endonuclease
MRGGYVYILTNRKHGALYTGVCADIAARVAQHRLGTGSKFCAECGIDRLVHVEVFEEIVDAIAREKAIKKWRRAWKIELIERANPDWRDLWFDLNR